MDIFQCIGFLVLLATGGYIAYHGINGLRTYFLNSDMYTLGISVAFVLVGGSIIATTLYHSPYTIVVKKK